MINRINTARQVKEVNATSAPVADKPLVIPSIPNIPAVKSALKMEEIVLQSHQSRQQLAGDQSYKWFS